MLQIKVQTSLSQGHSSFQRGLRSLFRLRLRRQSPNNKEPIHPYNFEDDPNEVELDGNPLNNNELAHPVNPENDFHGGAFDVDTEED